MTILLTGACGFVGATLARELVERGIAGVVGCDSFVRPGSERNRAVLRAMGVRFVHADLRCASDVDGLPAADVVIDAAANPAVLAGFDGPTASRQLVEHNLLGTVNLLEYCRRHRATLVLLSTSRVYSIPPLARLALDVTDDAFRPSTAGMPPGLSASGIDETFSTAPPVSLYGATKVAAERLALEYGDAFGFPVWVNRCGVLAGPGQFGRADQGIFSYWIAAWRAGRPLRYLGFGGTGHQVRDCLHPADLAPLILAQVAAGTARDQPRIVNVGGGVASAMSLAQLSAWCAERLGPREVVRDGTERPFDLPWVVLDAGLAARTWGWAPRTPRSVVLDAIAEHAAANPTWIETTEAG
jgi:CDP-paratose 2-epimerase